MALRLADFERDEDLDRAGAREEIKKPPQRTGPILPSPKAHENQPFVSPLKKQKERERKRRFALIRFVFLLLFTT